MKLEKINENQIKCIITKEDLLERKIKMEEIANCTSKAKKFLHEMIDIAENEFGFDISDKMVVVEAICDLNSDIVILITRSDSNNLNLKHFKKDKKISTFTLQGDNYKKSKINDKIKKEEKIDEKGSYCAYIFDNLDNVIKVSKVVKNFSNVKSILYKEEVKDMYLLVLEKKSKKQEEFDKICNVFSEYGIKLDLGFVFLKYLREHCKLMIEKDAINILSKI